MTAFRRKLQARFVEAGFWAQLVLLGLVDWGSLHAMRGAGGASLPVVAGFVALNAVLVTASVVMFRWMRQQGRSAHGG